MVFDNVVLFHTCLQQWLERHPLDMLLMFANFLLVIVVAFNPTFLWLVGYLVQWREEQSLELVLSVD